MVPSTQPALPLQPSVLRAGPPGMRVSMDMPLAARSAPGKEPGEASRQEPRVENREW